MSPSVRRVESTAERTAVASARLRLDLVAPITASSTQLAVFDGKRAIAGIAWTGFPALADASPWRECLVRLDVPLPIEAIALIDSLWFDPMACSGDAAQLLLDQAMDELRSGGIEMALVALPPHLVGHAEILGFRRVGAVFSEPDNDCLAMALVTGDWTHLERVRSPLLSAARRHAPNFELPDWFDQRLREYHRPAGIRAQRTDVFLHSLVSSWPLPAAPLLEDLGSVNLDCLRSFAQPLVAVPGQVLLHKGNTDHDLYLILGGAVEVSESTRHGREVLATLGAGQIFGEGGFFAHTPRSADITAIVPTQLLVLAPAAFELLGREHPAAAIQVLQALGRALCLRVYAGVAD